MRPILLFPDVLFCGRAFLVEESGLSLPSRLNHTSLCLFPHGELPLYWAGRFPILGEARTREGTARRSERCVWQKRIEGQRVYASGLLATPSGAWVETRVWACTGLALCMHALRVCTLSHVPPSDREERCRSLLVPTMDTSRGQGEHDSAILAYLLAEETTRQRRVICIPATLEGGSSSVRHRQACARSYRSSCRVCFPTTLHQIASAAPRRGMRAERPDAKLSSSVRETMMGKDAAIATWEMPTWGERGGR